MAFRKLLSTKPAFDGYKVTSQAKTPVNSTLQSTIPPNAPPKTNFYREYLSSPEPSEKGFFRRFLHRKAISQLPDFLSVPVGGKLREKLKSMNITGDRLRLDEVAPPVPGDQNMFGVSVEDAKKLLRISQLEKLKTRIREIEKSSIMYSEFVQICVEQCGNDEKQGVEFAKMLDQSGNVIVLGNIVFLRPEQVAKSMENIISQSIATPNDPRRKHLKQMELQKAMIDQKARAQVKGELYCGLGFMVAQTLGFMRLTFWELSWDVMEPICFFVTSLHFALAYVFFLRTSVEPSFEGYFQRRFKVKQQKLMKIHSFDIDKYNQLRSALYPDFGGTDNFPRAEHYKPFGHEDGMLLKSIFH